MFAQVNEDEDVHGIDDQVGLAQTDDDDFCERAERRMARQEEKWGQTASGLAQVNVDEVLHSRDDLPEFDYIQENFSPELVARIVDNRDWIDYDLIRNNFPCPSSPSTYEC